MLFIGALSGKWSFFFWIQYLGANGFSEAFDALEMWWLGYWAQQYEDKDQTEVSVS